MARQAATAKRGPAVRGRNPVKPKAGKSRSGEIDPAVARLMGAARLWEQGEVRTFEKTPPNKYDAEITGFTIDDNGNCRLKMMVEAPDPDTGEEKKYYPTIFYTFNRNGEDNAYAITNIKTDMARTQHEPPPNEFPLEEIARDIKDWGEGLIGQIARIRVERNKDKQGRTDDNGEVIEYENVYIQRLVTE